MSKVLTTLRTHWKKSIFFSAVGAYGVRTANKKRLESELMTQYCREAAEYGRVELPIQRPLYNVTVILNPAASKGGARAKYEQYCAPILHLAGIKVSNPWPRSKTKFSLLQRLDTFQVSVIRTESEGEAKDIMEIMKDADAVLIAGGDGTVMETITGELWQNYFLTCGILCNLVNSGFMRRPDSSHLSTALPIGVLPVGRANRLAQNLFPAFSSSTKAESEVEMMAGAAMACVKRLYRPVDVMQVENISENQDLKGKKIYAMSELQLGAFR